MATTKEQMNVQVTTAVKQLARTCATVRQKSLNVWVESAIMEKAARAGEFSRCVTTMRELEKRIHQVMQEIPQPV